MYNFQDGKNNGIVVFRLAFRSTPLKSILSDYDDFVKRPTSVLRFVSLARRRTS
jgi:hypothetical protein